MKKVNKSRRIGTALFRIRGCDERVRVMLVVPDFSKRKKSLPEYPGQKEFYICRISKSDWEDSLRFESLPFIAWVGQQLLQREPVQNGTPIEQLMSVIQQHCFNESKTFQEAGQIEMF